MDNCARCPISARSPLDWASERDPCEITFESAHDSSQGTPECSCQGPALNKSSTSTSLIEDVFNITDSHSDLQKNVGSPTMASCPV